MVWNSAWMLGLATTSLAMLTGCSLINGLTGDPSSADDDVEPQQPSVRDGAVMPETVEAGTPITLSWNVSSATGVTSTTFVIRNDGTQNTLPSSADCPQGNAAALVSGDEFDGTYEATCLIPANALSGAYTATAHSEGFGVTGDEKIGSFTVVGGTSDGSPPTLVSGSVAPSTITAGELLTIDWHLTSPSGVTASSFFIRHDETLTTMASSIDCPQGSARNPISGNKFDGTYQATCMTLSGARNGDYTVKTHVEDEVGNKVDLSVGTFTLTGGATDTTPAMLDMGSITPDPVTVGGTITLSWHLTSASGVTFSTFFIFNEDTQQFLPSSANCPMGNVVPRLSGNKFDGTYGKTCITSDAIAGNYSARAQVEDEAGNNVQLPIGTFTVQ